MKIQNALWQQVVSFLAIFVLWQVAAMIAQSDLLPGPLAVFSAMIREASEGGDLLSSIGVTMRRVVLSFVIAMFIGVGAGIAMGRSKKIDRLFDPWLVFFLNIPALVVIILSYVWFGLVEQAAIFAVCVNKIPNVTVTLREGARSLNRDYLEMARVFRFSRGQIMLHVVLPQLTPFIVAAARSGLSLIWKIVLVVELLGRSDGMGFQLYLFFQMFDVTNILAYSLAFILIIQVIEVGFFQPLERYVARWRR
jgi:NitT/TauT family transport system permease protein